jgi:peptidoglycan/LPS O-acetylase OafA/YrhL
VIRGIASLAVLLQHGCERYPLFNEASHAVFNLGRAAVVAFFLVSGFVIPFSLERSGSLKRFWVGRLFRLYPLYWASLIAAILLFAGGIVSPPLRFGVNAALLNITMFQGFVGLPHAIGAYWTLGLEIIFYMMLSALFIAGVNGRSLTLAWLTVGFTFLTEIALPLVLHRAVAFAPVELISAAMFGTLAYRWTTGAVTLRPVLAVYGAAAAVLGVAAYVHCGVYRKADGDSFSVMCTLSSIIGGYLLFFSLVAARHCRFPAPLLWLGRVSYSVYLTHPLVLGVLVYLALPSGALMPLAIAITLGVSELTYRCIECPAMQFGKKVTAWLQ